MKSNFWNGFFIKLHCYIYLGAMRWLNFLAHSNIGGRYKNKRLGKKINLFIHLGFQGTKYRTAARAHLWHGGSLNQKSMGLCVVLFHLFPAKSSNENLSGLAVQFTCVASLI
jgi:hypothetical protein